MLISITGIQAVCESKLSSIQGLFLKNICPELTSSSFKWLSKYIFLFINRKQILVERELKSSTACRLRSVSFIFWNHCLGRFIIQSSFTTIFCYSESFRLTLLKAAFSKSRSNQFGQICTQKTSTEKLNLMNIYITSTADCAISVQGTGGSGMGSNPPVLSLDIEELELLNLT